MKKIIGIIPSRLQSSRLPRKPLKKIHGRPMIIHVLERAKLCTDLSEIYVATDSEEIAKVVKRYHGKAILTSIHHKNGTERMAEAIQDLEGDIFVQIMGDEALLNPAHISDSIEAFRSSKDASASVLVTEFRKENSWGDFKAVLNLNNEIMYISRGDIPCAIRNPVDYRLKIYHLTCFSRDVLEKYSSMPKSPLEKIEDHEFLRLIENGYKIVAKKVDSPSISVVSQSRSLSFLFFV